MSQTSIPAVAPTRVATVLLSAVLVTFALLSIMFLLQENGMLLAPEAATYLHEVTHDARHALGVPCH